MRRSRRPPRSLAAVRALRGQIAVRRPDDNPPSGRRRHQQPLPGRAGLVRRASSTARRHGLLDVRRGRRDGPQPARSAIVAITVPLAALPVAPTGLTSENNETTLTLSWQRTRARPIACSPRPSRSICRRRRLLTPKPIDAPRFTQPVEFGRERCFVVRTVQATGGATVEGPPSEVYCATAVDRYPPPAPTNLRAIQEGSAITLTWTPSDAPDLGGYIVLRGDGGGVNMQPLIREPVREPAFKDESARSGETYTYSVYAVDTAPAPNVSQQSDRQIVTVR